MLPSELVQLIASHLDMASIVSLSQTSSSWRYAVSEDVFRSRMSSLCPWFEPQTSQYKTWKECALEFVWRVSRKTFAPWLKYRPGDGLDDGEFNFSKSLTPDQSSQLLRISLSPSQPSVYTSKYGIQVSFANVDIWSAPDFQEILSLPQLLAVLVIYQDVTTMIRGILVVKYRNSPGLEPDVNTSLPVCQKYRLLTSGSHLFLHIIDEIEPEGDIHYGEFFHVTGGGLRLLFTCQKPVVCFNGLFYFFSRRKLNCVQVCLNGSEAGTDTTSKRGPEPPTTVIYSRLTRPLKIKYCLYIGCDGYAFLGTRDRNKQLMWNMFTNEIFPLTHQLSQPQRFGFHAAKYACDDVTPFYNVSAPGINCLDAEDAEASGEEPEPPVMKAFALFVSLQGLEARQDLVW
ncbi:Hypothetical protein YALI2_F00994g [Yarrowia lipolytica]|nr:Hypothetical protein YALI2_F00994g [Yarrowia lipolytica]